MVPRSQKEIQEHRGDSIRLIRSSLSVMMSDAMEDGIITLNITLVSLLEFPQATRSSVFRRATCSSPNVRPGRLSKYPYGGDD